MAYYMFMGSMQIPIPPPAISLRVNGKNETVNLLNKGEVNIIKTAGLSDISFKIMLPNTNYPFNESLIFKSKKAKYYLDELEKMKINRQPFQFIVVRMKPNGTMLQMTNMKCTLEDYQVDEDAEEAFDVFVDISLKQWRDYGTKKIKLETDSEGNVKGTVEQNRDTSGKVAAQTVKASQGTTLQRIVKEQFGNTNNVFAIASLNKVAVPAALTVGQVLKMR